MVLCGDITQRARPSQFAAARVFMERLKVPLLAIAGNHDIPLFNLGARLLHPYAHYSEAFGDELEPVHSSPDLLVLCVNTTRWYRHINGAVSRAQAKRVAARLSLATPEQLRIVVVHHPIAVLRSSEAHNLLRGHINAQHSWAAAGCDLVLGGHIHLPYVMALPHLARPMWAVQAGSAVSTRLRDGAANSVNLLRWGGDTSPGCCMIEQWDYASAARAFVCKLITEVHPGRTPATRHERQH
jgi:predicted phosphodiesterase